MTKKRILAVFLIIALAVILVIVGVKMLAPKDAEFSITYETELVLDVEMEEFFEDFLQEAYRYMGSWEETDLTKWFDESAKEEALICQNAYDLLVEMRSLRDVDLTFECQEIKAVVTNITVEDGVYQLEFKEGYTIQFPFMEEPSISQGIKCTMGIIADEDGYKLTYYTRKEDFYSLVTEEYEIGNEDPEGTLAQIRADIIEEFKVELEKLAEAKANVEYETVECDIPLDREASKEYALTYALERNSDEWFVFDSLGGNCQNFGSQVIYNGGMPMDITGPGVWKYYDLTPHQGSGATGRSAAWSGVPSFYAYAKGNVGTGLCCEVDANVYTAEAGDIMQVGDGTGAYVHTIVSIGPIYDEEGNILDINTCSNTTDRKNYPMSAYNCPYIRLIKVYGYNY